MSKGSDKAVTGISQYTLWEMFSHYVGVLLLCRWSPTMHPGVLPAVPRCSPGSTPVVSQYSTRWSHRTHSGWLSVTIYLGALPIWWLFLATTQLHLELTKLQEPGYTCEVSFFCWIIWGRKTDPKPLSFEVVHLPELWDTACGRPYKGHGRRKFLLPPCTKPTSSEFEHILKSSWDIQPHKMKNYQMLGLSVGK